MQFDGRIKSWDDDRGVGIIEPMKGGHDVLAHIAAFARGSGRPRVGQRVAFEVEPNPDGTKRATNVEFRRAPSGPRVPGRSATPAFGPLSLIVLALFAAVYVVTAKEWQVPTYFASAYLGLSLACYLALAADRTSARKRRNGISDQKLLLLGVLGGWPGSLLAQYMLGQKSVAGSFHMLFWATALVNVAALLLMSSPQVHLAW